MKRQESYDAVTTATVGHNADLFVLAASIYIHPGDRVLDATWGEGRFWRRTAHRRLMRTDVVPVGDKVADMRSLPFSRSSFDVVVLDPPFKAGTSAQMREDFDGYRNNARAARGVAAVADFYLEGMREARRVLRPGGRLLLKCMDQVESGSNHFMHIELYRLATEQLRMAALDLFVLVRKSKPTMRHPYQHHARKNHSFLWAFAKATGRR